MRPCTNCSDGELSRSRRRGNFDALLSWFDWYPYRCDQCHSREYCRGNDLTAPSEANSDHRLTP